MIEKVLGEFQGVKAARAARETIAALLKGTYDLSRDCYTVVVDGEVGTLIIKELGRNSVQHVLELPDSIPK